MNTGLNLLLYQDIVLGIQKHWAQMVLHNSAQCTSCMLKEEFQWRPTDNILCVHYYISMVWDHLLCEGYIFAYH